MVISRLAIKHDKVCCRLSNGAASAQRRDYSKTFPSLLVVTCDKGQSPTYGVESRRQHWRAGRSPATPVRAEPDFTSNPTPFISLERAEGLRRRCKTPASRPIEKARAIPVQGIGLDIRFMQPVAVGGGYRN